MKALVQHSYGSADVLHVEEVPRPVPGDDEVLLEVVAAGVGAEVWHVMEGRPYLVRLFGIGFRRPKVAIRGMDVAGRVVAAGRNVRGFTPGDDVFGTSSSGSFAEFALAKESKLVRKPAGLTFEHAAAIPVSGCAALHALRDEGKVGAGQKVLILGAGGGVGTFAVQLAVAFGADVTAVCSAGKAGLVTSLGARRVVDYARQDFAEGRPGYDLIVDIAGNNPLRRLRKALGPAGTVVIVGGEGGGPWFGGIDRQLRAALVSPFVRQTFKVLVSSERADAVQALSDLVQAGKVRPVVDRIYSLDEAPEAVRQLHKRNIGGKAVISL